MHFALSKNTRADYKSVNTHYSVIILELDFMTIVKIVELIGSSPNNWEEATKNALADAAKTIRGIKSIHVKKITAKVANNEIVEYRSLVKVAFTVERE